MFTIKKFMRVRTQTIVEVFDVRVSGKDEIEMKCAAKAKIECGPCEYTHEKDGVQLRSFNRDENVQIIEIKGDE